MRSVLLSGIFMTLAVELTGCASLSTSNDDLPLIRQVCLVGLMQDREIRAALSLQTAGRKEEYFLAIRAGKNTADIVLLAPQGIPVYSIHCTDSNIEVSSQARVTAGVQPSLMLSYLEMIFIGVEDIRKELKPQWTIEEREDGRLLAKHSADGQLVGEIQIAYGGHFSQFNEVKLEDPQRDTTLTLVKLGGSSEIPE